MLFPMISTLFHEDDGIIPNNDTLGEKHEKSWKIDDHKINPGSFRWCLGIMVRSTLLPPAGPLGDPMVTWQLWPKWPYFWPLWKTWAQCQWPRLMTSALRKLGEILRKIFITIWMTGDEFSSELPLTGRPRSWKMMKNWCIQNWIRMT